MPEYNHLDWLLSGLERKLPGFCAYCPLKDCDLLRICTDCIKAVDCMHAQGFAHLDIKPLNLIAYCAQASNGSSTINLRTILADLDAMISVPKENPFVSVADVGLHTRSMESKDRYNSFLNSSLNMYNTINNVPQHKLNKDKFNAFEADHYAMALSLLVIIIDQEKLYEKYLTTMDYHPGRSYSDSHLREIMEKELQKVNRAWKPFKDALQDFCRPRLPPVDADYMFHHWLENYFD